MTIDAAKKLVSGLLRGPAASRLLSGLGIDPRRYWLLMDLFRSLSERGEMLDQMGLNGYAVKRAAMVYFALSAFLAFVFMMGGPPAGVYLTIFLGMTAVLLLSMLTAEAGNSLFNPAEATILAHQPIDGATYTAAKLSHLLRIVFYLVPGINIIPAFTGLLLKGTSWFYPILHLACAFGVGFGSALVGCGFLGWIMRFVPVRRLKAAGQLAGALPMLAMTAMQPARRLFGRVHLDAAVARVLSHPALRWALAITVVVAIVSGLRSLTADYLIRVSALTRGGASAGSRTRASTLGAIVRRWFGGQPAMAGFAFVSRMMLRDWHFRRQMLSAAIAPLMALAAVFRTGWPTDPFSRQFSAAHLMPHALGILLAMACGFLPFGNDYKGVWIFLAIPSKAFDRFASGVFAVLWLDFILIPHLVAAPFEIWYWGLRHALLFALWSIAAASVYLGLELRLIDGIPFTKQMQGARQSFALPMLLAAGMAIAIAVALQYFVIFRSEAAVGITMVVLGAGALIVIRSSLDTIATGMRYQLSLLSVETGTLYKEIAA
jgi:hypothetical protein